MIVFDAGEIANHEDLTGTADEATSGGACPVIGEILRQELIRSIIWAFSHF